MTRNLRTIALVCLAIAGCLDGAAPSAKPVAKANVWTAAADRLDAGQWKDSTHRLVKDVTHVAKITKTPLPADYDAFWAPHIAKNVPIDDTRRAAIAKKLREWGAAK